MKKLHVILFFLSISSCFIASDNENIPQKWPHVEREMKSVVVAQMARKMVTYEAFGNNGRERRHMMVIVPEQVIKSCSVCDDQGRNLYRVTFFPSHSNAFQVLTHDPRGVIDKFFPFQCPMPVRGVAHDFNRDLKSYLE